MCTYVRRRGSEARAVARGLLVEVFVRGAEKGLSGWFRLQHVEPWESRLQALNAPFFQNFRQSDKSNYLQ